jgi:hypothetical protein
MKGVIFSCLKELVETKFGEEKWAEIVKGAGLAPDTRFLPIDDVDDAVVLKTIASTCSVLGITQQQAADAFGEYWVCDYAPKLYGAYFGGTSSARDLLLRMDDVHVSTTRSMANARPPRFDYEQPDDDTLIMRYRSARGLVPIFAGLVRGVVKRYGETADVSIVGADKVKVVFH